MKNDLRQYKDTLASWSKGQSDRARHAIGLGDRMRDQRQWHTAAEHYREALDEVPNNQPIWVQYGHALKESGQLPAAEEAYRKAVTLKPSDSDAHLQLGHCLKVKGNFIAAADCYLQALQVDPDNRFAKLELEHFGWTAAELAGQAKAPPSHAAVPGQHFKPVHAACPEAYEATFGDVATLVATGIIESVEQHFDLYGYKQGRDILATFTQTKPTAAFILCPSFFKRCGIGEHSRYLAQSIESSGLTTYPIRSTADLANYSDHQLRDAVLIVNHGPGLFDGYNPELSEGEATIDLLNNLRRYFTSHNLRPIMFMHSLLDRDNTVMFPRQQMALEVPIPVVTTIEAAARTFNIPRVEHGMQPIALPAPPAKAANARDLPTIGFFGFFQWGGKNFDALFNVAQKIKAKLVGSIATGGEEQVTFLKEIIREKGIRCDIGTGWVEDSELAWRLNEADFYYLPQHDYDHWNNSGTARFVINFARPVIVPPHNPFLDLRAFVIFAEDDDLPQVMAHLRSADHYDRAARRVAAYGEAHAMPDEMARLARAPHEIAIASGTENFFDINRTCAAELLHVDLPKLQARVDHVSPGNGVNLKSAAATAERRAEIARLQQHDPANFANDHPVVLPLQYWREHYEIGDLVFEDRLESFYAACRAILKREPDLHDFVRFHPGYAANSGKPAAHFAEHSLRLIARLMGTGHTLEFASQVRLYHHGRRLDVSDLADPALADNLLARHQQTQRIQAAIAGPSPITPVCAFYNIVQMLPCPADVLDELLHSAARKLTVAPDFSMVAKAQDPFQRLLAISGCLSSAGLSLSDLFVLDKPTVRPVDVTRKRYGLGEFWLLEGDYFLFEAVTCLLKRAPLAAEMYLLDEISRTAGKIGVLRHLLNLPGCQAEVADIESCDEDQLRYNAAACATIAAELRSVHAGGWDQRNAYLEAVRNNKRLWLNIKRQRDRFMSQAGERFEVVTAAVAGLRAL
jgi:tetratricopeptide (TPR) repeat protein